MTDTELREKLRLIARWGDYEENGKWGRGIGNMDDLIALITQYGDTREREGRKAARERNAELLNALGLMYGQYCPKRLGHDFMGAGEAAIGLLEEYGIHDEYSEWSDKTYDKLEKVVAELKEEV